MSDTDGGHGRTTTGAGSASRATAMVFGTLAGLGGMTHGVGEVLQGDVTPDGVVIDSWTQGPIAEFMGREPGMTVVPHLLTTGIVCLVVAASIVAVSLTGLRRRHGGLALLLLSIALLLTGGGFAPPLFGILAGVAGVRAGRSRPAREPQGALQSAMARAWPWLFALSGLSAFVLTVGSVPYVYIARVDAADFFVGLFGFSLLTQALAVAVAGARDARRTAEAVGAVPASATA